jgi:hypothetical protein
MSKILSNIMFGCQNIVILLRFWLYFKGKILRFKGLTSHIILYPALSSIYNIIPFFTQFVNIYHINGGIFTNYNVSRETLPFCLLMQSFNDKRVMFHVKHYANIDLKPILTGFIHFKTEKKQYFTSLRMFHVKHSQNQSIIKAYSK